MTKPKCPNASNLWANLRDEAARIVKKEPALRRFFASHILDRKNFGDSLCFLLASKLAENLSGSGLEFAALLALFKKSVAGCPAILSAAKKDLLAVLERDPAVTDLRTPFLYCKGYQAIQTHRIAHYLWLDGQRDTARYLQSQNSARFDVDIHPAARLGRGIMLDHATGTVIGETAVIGDDVSMLHGVTLGGTGKELSDRHPKICKGVLIGANATILGNIVIGEGSRIAAGSVVLKSIPPRVTVAGVPARIVGKAGSAKPAVVMDQIPRFPETAGDTSLENCDFPF